MIQHIVLVDDAPSNLEILSSIVSRIPGTVVHGFTVSLEAIAWTKEHTADAFLIDYNMPEPNGLAMIKLLRADPRHRLVPIVVVTGVHDFEVRLTALAAGANDFLERPIEQREVVSRMETLLTLQAARIFLATHVGELERNLLLEERKSRAQAERLATLWRVANASYDPRREDAVQAVLSEGSATMRSEQTFFGRLMRVDGDHAIMLAVARPDGLAQRTSFASVGARLRLDEMAEHFVVEASRTLSWAEVADDPVIADLPRVRLIGERALISSPFRVGRTTYVLSFGSLEPAMEPFGRDDTTYVELLADFFANRLQQAAQSDQLIYHMSHDMMTGLRNRTQFRLDARGELVTKQCGALVAVCMDNFRGINEEYGHIIGDALLVEIGARLSKTANVDDVVGRLAGDTFGLFFGGMATEHELRERLDEVAQHFTHPFSTGDRDGREFVPVGATLGAALSVAKGALGETETIDRLLARADIAAVAARMRGPGNIEIYRQAMESQGGMRARRLSEISYGLENDQFELFLQPHLDLHSSTIVGAEALLRWRHPQHGLLLPAAFLPFAENNGLIRSITRWVTSTALVTSQRLRAFDSGFRVYFNLSAIDFCEDAIVSDLRVAAAAGLHLENVGVELTETAAMQDVASAARTLRELQALGVTVALDDFGTGYSSLSMLTRLTFDVIKIDRFFIDDVLTGERDSAIASSIIAIGRQLGYDTLAEGVETPAQIDWLRQRGCRFAQGYSIARPMPLDTFEQWLVDQPSNTDIGKAEATEQP